MLVLFFAQGAKAYFAWVVFSCPLRNSFRISRHHANIRRWCYGVAPWVDVSEIPWRLTEALVIELSVCVALGWSLYEIYSVQKFHQSRHLVKTKLHPEYPHRKKMNPALSKKLVFFANRNTQKNMQLFDKIHTMYFIYYMMLFSHPSIQKLEQYFVTGIFCLTFYLWVLSGYLVL